MRSMKFRIVAILFVLLAILSVCVESSIAFAQESIAATPWNSYANVEYEPSSSRAIGDEVYLGLGIYRIRAKIVNLTTDNGNSVEAYRILDELPNNAINSFNSDGDSLSNNNVRLYSATARFNCHSYAWYSQSYDNDIWLNDPSLIIRDGGYVEMANPHVGDRICYFDQNGVNLHSGIVAEVLDTEPNGICGLSNIVNVVSKWGAWGLYRHRGDECPYTSRYNGDAVSIKFYHKHDYSQNVVSGTGKHAKICNICGIKVESYHKGSFTNLGVSAGHSGTCDVCGFSGQEGHVWEKTAVKFICGTCRAVSKYVEIEFPGLSCVNELYLRNGEYIIMNGYTLLHTDGKYYVLFEEDNISGLDMFLESLSRLD